MKSTWDGSEQCLATEYQLIACKHEVSIPKGSPQREVLIAELLNLMINELRNILNRKGFYAERYASDIVTEFLQQALKIMAERWGKFDPTINAEKTAMQQMDYKEVKNLDLTLEAKLNWNSNLQKTTNKWKLAHMATKRDVDKKWGLKPRIGHWLYITVIRSMVL